ncbi:MAG TPA: serine hydrolase [Vicinamibacterales bacterium]|nr:serine hydrolase [Vicinamibacterales bacterium]
MVMPFKTIRIAAILLFFTASIAFSQDTARMEQVIQSHVKAGTFMGTVLVAKDGAVVLDKAYGMANLELDVPNTPATKFRLGSITKQFTAAAILLLEERGKLKVDDRTKTYMPDQPMAWDRITIYNLLTHTSGIANFTALPSYNSAKGAATTVDGTIATLRDRVLDFGPGEQMSYSNSGYLVLGSIIEKVSGQSYEKFLADNFFTPLGMTDTGYDSNTAIIKRRASGYVRTGAGYANAGYVHMSVPHAAGALYSTTGDLLKWEQALFGGKVISKASVDRMITPFKNDYALGVASTLDKGRRAISHGGGIDGFNTYMSYYPDSRTVVIVLSNVNGNVPGTLAGQLAALMHGDAVTLTSERVEVKLPAATLSKYVGAYQLAPAAIMTITLEGEQLMAQLTGQGKLQIFPSSETMFFLKVVDAQLEFAADGSSLVLHQNGRAQKAARKP